MSEEQMKALFLLAGIDVISSYKLPNQYWPENEHYEEVRRNSPWWLAITKFGPIEIGWRKRVISISWHGTPVRVVVTTDDLTKDESMVHAYSYAKAVEYLTSLAREMHRLANQTAVPA